MAIDPALPRSRRAILAAGLGGLAAAIGTSLGRPASALATDGQPLVVGQANSATSETVLTQSTGSVRGLRVVGAAGAAAIQGETATHIGVVGMSDSGTGVAGTSGTGQGVGGSSGSDYGVRGTTGNLGPAGTMGQAPQGRVGVFGYSGAGDPTPPGALGAAVLGRAQTGHGTRGDSDTLAGAVGYSGPAVDTVPAVPTKTGVYGYANADANARGVSGNSPLGTAVYGSSVSGFGLRGVSTSNTGLRGDSTTGTAVRALSVSGRAINASSGGTATPALSSQVTTSDVAAKAAIQGFVGAAGLPAAATQTGVQGRCDISSDSVGVLGESSVGIGVFGDTGDGYGVMGIGYYGVYGSGAAGVVGDVDGGTGVQGWSGVDFAPDPLPAVGVWAGAETGRTALQVTGVAKFSRSGKATVAVGASSVAVTVAGGLTSGSFGVASPQTNRAGYYVQAVVPTVATGQIRIYLNKAVTTSAISVGWMVVG